jgi:hypothetical protein
MPPDLSRPPPERMTARSEGPRTIAF